MTCDVIDWSSGRVAVAEAISTRWQSETKYRTRSCWIQRRKGPLPQTWCSPRGPWVAQGTLNVNKGRLNHNRNSIKCKPFCQVFNIFNWAPKSKMLALRWCCLIIIRFLPLYTCFFNQYISFRYSWSATEKSKERGLFGVAVSLQSTWHKCGSALKPLQFEKMRLVNSVNLFWRTTELSARAPMMGSHKNYVEFVWICHCCHLKLLDTTTFCQTPRQGQK
jgi:hypothetical protein